MLVYQRVDVGCILIALGPIFFHILQDVLRDLHPEEPPEQLPEVLQCDAAVAQMWHLGMFWAKKPEFTGENGDESPAKMVISPAKLVVQEANMVI
jgi:hypothetical protein